MGSGAGKPTLQAGYPADPKLSVASSVQTNGDGAQDGGLWRCPLCGYSHNTSRDAECQQCGAPWASKASPGPKRYPGRTPPEPPLPGTPPATDQGAIQKQMEELRKKRELSGITGPVADSTVTTPPGSRPSSPLPRHDSAASPARTPRSGFSPTPLREDPLTRHGSVAPSAMGSECTPFGVRMGSLIGFSMDEGSTIGDTQTDVTESMQRSKRSSPRALSPAGTVQQAHSSFSSSAVPANGVNFVPPPPPPPTAGPAGTLQPAAQAPKRNAAQPQRRQPGKLLVSTVAASPQPNRGRRTVGRGGMRASPPPTAPRVVASTPARVPPPPKQAVDRTPPLAMSAGDPRFGVPHQGPPAQALRNSPGRSSVASGPPPRHWGYDGRRRSSATSTTSRTGEVSADSSRQQPSETTAASSHPRRSRAGSDCSAPDFVSLSTRGNLDTTTAPGSDSDMPPLIRHGSASSRTSTCSSPPPLGTVASGPPTLGQPHHQRSPTTAGSLGGSPMVDSPPPHPCTPSPAGSPGAGQRGSLQLLPAVPSPTSPSRRSASGADNPLDLRPLGSSPNSSRPAFTAGFDRRTSPPALQPRTIPPVNPRPPPGSAPPSGRSPPNDSPGRAAAETGKKINVKWDKNRCLGRGSCGSVYLGFDMDTGAQVAVKEVDFPADLNHDKGAMERLRRLLQEIKLLQTLQNPNIVRYVGIERRELTVCIIMEFVPGGSILHILRKFGALSERVTLRYTSQLLCGMDCIHSRGIMHRDIKGANVMVDQWGTVKLADFGNARQLHDGAAGPHSLSGTPYWMAPEVIRQSEYGLPADVWSLGATVIEMATAKPPWSDLEPHAALFTIGHLVRAPPIPQDFELFSVELLDFVQVCMQREPHARPTVTDLLMHAWVAACEDPPSYVPPAPTAPAPLPMAAVPVAPAPRPAPAPVRKGPEDSPAEAAPRQAVPSPPTGVLDRRDPPPPLPGGQSPTTAGIRYGALPPLRGAGEPADVSNTSGRFGRKQNGSPRNSVDEAGRVGGTSPPPTLGARIAPGGVTSPTRGWRSSLVRSPSLASAVSRSVSHVPEEEPDINGYLARRAESVVSSLRYQDTIHTSTQEDGWAGNVHTLTDASILQCATIDATSQASSDEDGPRLQDIAPTLLASQTQSYR
eukprot:TRINITY_DN6785_c0_g1_i2.p1 TRINITY_DN6785_c0_g1~~TRINITY_DN6785_c0_g1_i2.p1  ORF type:complete len:1144 (+),score=248.05 TRINITY_DN6785_c0_g1_i2:121-3552(+)